MTTTTADWARFYARAGWRSFPLKPGSKQPMFSGWPKDATTSTALIDQWQVADRNLGLVTGEGFDAWDIEGAHLSAFSAWLHRTGAMPADPPIASTGRGGVHILTAPTGVDGSRNLYLDGTHIGELKSRGGFIVACPSEVVYDEHVGDYVWVNLPQLPVPEATPGLLGLLERPRTGVPKLPSRITALDDVKPRLEALGRAIIAVRNDHKRNAYLYWAVIRAVEEGVPAGITGEALFDAYMTAAVPGDDDAERRREAQKTIESALTSVAA